jgi:hypothetical protein
MERLAGVFLHMNARQADVRGGAVNGDVEPAAECQRPLVLRDLIALRQIRIEVVLAREDRFRLETAPQRECRLDGVVDGNRVEDGKRAGKPEADRADLRVRRRAEIGPAAAEHFGRRSKLRVDL